MSDKRKTLTLPAKEAHDPRFGIFVAKLLSELERRGDEVTFFALARAVEAARREAFGE